MKREVRPLSIAVLLLLAVGASGCLGGSGGNSSGGGPVVNPPPPPPSSSVAGLWSGAVWWEPKDGFPGGALNVLALVAETGEFRWVLADQTEQLFGHQTEQIFGTFDVDGTAVNSTGNAIWAAELNSGNATGELLSSFGLSGELEERANLSGTFQANWSNSEERVGDFSLVYHSLYERESSLEILQGIYSTATESLSIDNQGVIFYQSSDTGCTGNGSATVIDPDFNMYRVEMEIGSCTGGDAIRNGLAFAGLGYVGVNNESGGGFLNDTFAIAVTADNSPVFGPGPAQIVVWSLSAHKE